MTARVGIITFPGTLDDVDAARAVKLAGAEAVSLWHADADLKDVEKRLSDHLLRVETRLNLLLEGDARGLSHWPRGMAERARRLADRGASDAA